MAQKIFDFVDTELLGDPEASKTFRQTAYAMGAGIGFLLVLPTLPDVGENQQVHDIIHLFNMLSLFLFFYSGLMGASFIWMRGILPHVQMILNWFLVPSVAIWCVTEGHRIITGGH